MLEDSTTRAESDGAMKGSAKVEKKNRHKYGGRERKGCRNSDKKERERDKNRRLKTKKAVSRGKKRGGAYSEERPKLISKPLLLLCKGK